jgi:hypothetical protein
MSNRKLSCNRFGFWLEEEEEERASEKTETKVVLAFCSEEKRYLCLPKFYLLAEKQTLSLKSQFMKPHEQT